LKAKIRKINLKEKFGLFDEHWSPKIIAGLNDSFVKLVKVKGEFIRHRHEKEDELFLVVRGSLTVRLRNQDLTLKEGELVVIPKGMEHKPIAVDEVQLLLLEPKTTVNTGNIRNEKTTASEWI
jgi:mannose-6-phosphate isomerase-like protein (cupin superfamily)